MKEKIEVENEYVILVNELDIETGEMEKLTVHQMGLLHRAFSVFIFNSNSELLLQQRADGKYHSPGLWTNTCCSHPKPGESTLNACKRRLMEEMGMGCDLEFQFSFIYKFQFANGLTEHEFDHVFFGRTDDLPEMNLTEVKNWRYINLSDLENEITIHPENYTAWLKICMPKIKEQLPTNSDKK